jgi:hypothetical protein
MEMGRWIRIGFVFLQKMALWQSNRTDYLGLGDPMPGLVVVEYQASTMSVLIGNDSDRVGLLSVGKIRTERPLEKLEMSQKLDVSAQT